MDNDVREVLAHVPIDEALVDRQMRRAAHRRLFREMIKSELESGSLTWPRRRALVKFADRLEIDRFEARLLIRGVEYEGALIPPCALPTIPESLDLEDSIERRKAAIVRWLIIGALIAVNYFLIRHGSGASS